MAKKLEDYTEELTRMAERLGKAVERLGAPLPEFEGSYDDVLVIKHRLEALQVIFDKEVDMYRIRVTKTAQDYNYFIPEEKQLTDSEYHKIKVADNYRKAKVKGRWEH